MRPSPASYANYRRHDVYKGERIKLHKLHKNGRASFICVVVSVLCCGCYGPDHSAINAAGGYTEDSPITELMGDAQGVVFQTDPGIDDARLRSLLPALKGIKVRVLIFQSGGITDNSIATISQLDTLVYLDLLRTRITPNGLSELKRLPHLETIEVGGPMWTTSAIRAVEAKLPGVKIDNTEVLME